MARNPNAAALAENLLRVHDTPSEDPDTQNVTFERLALALAKAVLKSPSALVLGRKGGASKSHAKINAARLNGQKGGRPPKPKP